jgi:pyruvate-ferredoxin/flavodoxin oxidoreductase
LGELREALDEQARRELAHAVELPGAAALAAALEHDTDGDADPRSPADLVARLEAAGGGGDVDVERLRRLAQASTDLAGLQRRLTEGHHGTGRSRFGILVAGSAAGWAAQFPRNPFCVPVEVDLTGGGADLALGLAEGWLDRHAQEMAALRDAERLVDGVVEREGEASASTGWSGLTEVERALCPPLIVLAGTDGLGGAELPGLARLLDAGLPLRVLLLDPRDLREPSVDPTLLAVAHRQAFVLASSIAHPHHLFEGVGAALAYDGPALFHVHAPSPSRDGYSTERTIARARKAVDSRVHPLVRYDPSAEGTFGLRLDVTANPQPESTWATGDDGVEWTPSGWAAGEARFTADGTVEAEVLRAQRERQGNWETLREVAGLCSPFTGRIEERLAGELKASHDGQIAALRADHERQLAETRRTQAAEQIEQLRARLLRLAGFGRGGGDETGRTGPA